MPVRCAICCVISPLPSITSPPSATWAGRRPPAHYDARSRVGALPAEPAARVGVGAPRLLFYDGIYAKVTIRSQISEKLGFGAPADDAGWRIAFTVSIVI